VGLVKKGFGYLGANFWVTKGDNFSSFTIKKKKAPTQAELAIRFCLRTLIKT